MEQIERIKLAREQALAKEKHDQQHRELLDAQSTTRETILRSFSILTDYLDSKITKTEVINPTTSVSTPDIDNVVKSLQDLSEVVKNSQPDFSPVIDKLSALESQLQAIPKEHQELPEQKEDVKVTNLSDIDFSVLEEAIKAIDIPKTDLKPIITSLSTVVSAINAINLPDLDTKPLETAVKAVEKAVKGIKIDIPKTDLSGVEKKLEKSNKLLKEIADKPIGGGGGGASWPAVNSSGIAQPLTVDGSGALNITGSITASASTLADFSVNDISEGTTSYFGYTKPDGTWLVKSLTDTSVGYATVSNNGTVTSYTDAWTNRATTLTYGRFDEAF